MRMRLRQLFPLSIRMQLALWYTLVFAVLLLLTGAGFYTYLESSLEAGVDDALQLRAQQIAGDVVVKKDGSMSIYRAGGDMPGFGTASNVSLQPGDVNYGVLVRLFDAHGHLVGETPAFRTLQLPAESVEQPLHGTTWQGTVHEDGQEEVHIYSQVLVLQGQKVAVIQVGQSLATLHTLLHTLVALLLVVGSGVLLLCAVLSYWFAAHAFKPVLLLTQSARRIKQGDLHQRVPVPATHDEVHYLAVTLNEMIESLDQAFTRQQRFVSDASHELRTPIAVIRNKAGVALLETPTLQETVTTLQDIRTETERLSTLINDLLVLARGDEGKSSIEQEVVQLDQVVEAVSRHLEPLAAEDHITLDVAITAPVTVIGDEARLMQVLLNLLDNAIRYTDAGGSICVQLDTTPTQARVQVRDTGIGMAPEHLAHIFERFYRADPARERTDGKSTGLGLSIVEWIVRLHKGTITVESQVGQGSCFTVLLPRTLEECL